MGNAFAIVRLTLGGLVALGLGIGLISSGDAQSVVIGIATIIVGVAVLGGLALVSKMERPVGPLREVTDQTAGIPPTVIIWLGIVFAFLPGLLYLYLKFAMTRFDPDIVVIVSVPVFIASFGCLALGVWSLKMKQRDQSEVAEREETH